MASGAEPEDKVAPLYHYPVIFPCDLCETKDDVNSFCRNCSQNLCDGCKRTHLRSTVSRDHNVVHISEGKRSESEVTFCAEHGERLFFYCRTCSALFCQKCLNPRHKNHDFLDIDEYAKELQSKIAMLIEEKTKKVEERRRNVQHIEESKKKYADTFTKNKRSIMDTAKRLRHEVDRVETELLSSLGNHVSNGLAKFDVAHTQEKTIGDKLQESLDNLIRYSKKHDNISLVACANKIIEDCQDSDPDMCNFGVPAVEFRALRLSKDAVSKLFGSLQYSDAEFSRKYTEDSMKSPGSQTKQNKSSHDLNRRKEVPQREELNKSFLCTCIRNREKHFHSMLEEKFNTCSFCRKRIF